MSIVLEFEDSDIRMTTDELQDKYFDAELLGLVCRYMHENKKPTAVLYVTMAAMLGGAIGRSNTKGADSLFLLVGTLVKEAMTKMQAAMVEEGKANVSSVRH